MIRGITFFFLISANVLAQDLHLEVAQRLTSHYTSKPVLKLHLFFNQPEYAPGDTAYFRAALVSASEMLPVRGSQIAELDIVDEHGNTLVHQEFRIRDGWTGNQLVIPRDFNAGVYRVIAYTNWMRNFGEEAFYRGTLHVAGQNTFMRSSAAKRVHLFVEGGTLVAGVRNRVVVQTVGHQNRGMVVTSGGDHVTDFTVNKKGLGFFFVIPQEDETYTVSVANDEQILGPGKPDGVSLLLLPAAQRGPVHRFVFQTPAQSALRSEKLYFVISGHGEVFYSANFRFDQLEFVALSVNTNSLPDGVALATLFREDGQVVASRLVYTRNDVVSVQFEFSDSTYRVRDRVSPAISVRDQSGRPLQARMSVSVFNKSLFSTDMDQPEIDRHLLIHSDLPDLVEAEWESASELDLNLVTSVWHWYTMAGLKQTPKSTYYAKSFPELHGRVINTLNDRPPAEPLQLTLYLQRAADVYEVETGPDGEFVAAPLFDFPQSDELVYLAEGSGLNVPVRLELRADHVRHTPWAGYNISDQEDRYYAYARLREQVRQSFGYFGRSPQREAALVKNPNAQLEDELLGADLSFTLSDYTLMPTMQETLHEIIPYLQYRKIRGNDVVRMYLPDLNQTGDGPPAFIIDGVLTQAQDYFLRLKPTEVDKVKIIYSQYKRTKLGAFGRNGIVFVETKIPDHSRAVPRGPSVPVSGLTSPLRFTAEETLWEKGNPRTPRMRSTLFWDPHIQTDQQGRVSFSFTTSDDPGEYVIVVEGLTFDGSPFRVERRFNVRHTASEP